MLVNLDRALARFTNSYVSIDGLMIIPDHETEIDFLNGEATSRTVVQLLSQSRDRPLTIGIHGEWGAGKSSVLRMIEAKLRTEPKVAVLWFNGWAFEGFDDAKMVFIETTITELVRQRTTGRKVAALAKRLLQRVNWLKLLKRAPGLAINVLTGLPSPDQLHSALTILGRITERAADIDPSDLPEKMDQVRGLLKPDEADSLPETIHSFRAEFQNLLDETKVDQLVVLIDDLDRCLPATAVETLEAIRLFLFVPKTAFVIGADEGMIEYAVRQHFPDLPVASGPLPYSRNYLEKLVQIPFRIPALGGVETRTYVTLLLVQALVGEDHDGFRELVLKTRNALDRPWLASGLLQSEIRAVDKDRQTELDAAFFLAQQIAPILAQGTKGNPRQVKRFLNALLIRQAIATARGFHDSIEQPVLAKLMLAERFQPDFYDHIAAQAMRNRDGQSADICALESTEEDTNSQPEAKPPQTREEKAKAFEHDDLRKWREHEWIAHWLALQPAIGERDLRPYVFVARDKSLITSTTDLSGLDALVERLCGPRLTVIAAGADVAALTPVDADAIFAALRERVLAAGSFESVPSGVDGLSIVAKHHPRLQSEIVSLLQGLDSAKLGTWVVRGWNDSITEQQTRDDLTALMRSWANQDGNDLLKRAAAASLSTPRRERA